MEIDRYFDSIGDQIVFSRQQSSDFAKQVAGDFNPLHDIDAKRFCVPGDLLFAVFLHRHGVSESMTFQFLNMVDAAVPLVEEQTADLMVLADAKNRQYLTTQTAGGQSRETAIVSGLTEAYVQFSGQTFPYLLVDLMRNNGMMINPSRPLVIYKSMHLSLRELAGEDITLEFSGAEFTQDGKKATVDLNFAIHAGGDVIGSGQKQMVLGGLRAFEEDVMEALVQEYQSIKTKYAEASA